MTLRIYIMGAVVAVILSGCSASWDMQGNDPVEYYADHPIKNTIETRNQSYAVHFASSETRLSPDEIDKLRDEVRTISMLSVDAIHIDLSKADANNDARKEYIAKLLRSMGYSKGDIQFGMAAELPRGNMKLDLTYSVVISPNCPDWRMSPVTSYSNTTQGNFKCAQEVNVGLMVADPHDLVQGTGDVDVDTQRSAKAVQNYEAGVITTPAAPSSASGSSTGSSSSSSSSGTSGSGTAPQ